MFHLSCWKRGLSQLALNSRYVGDSPTHLCSLLNNAPLIIIRLFSSIKASDGSKKHEDKQKEYPFTVSYLMNSCGLSQESAVSASKYVNFTSRERPDSVLRLLRDHGFTGTHIPKIVKSRPSLLLAKPEETLLPKLYFFYSIGVSSSDLPGILCQNPTLLTRSLQNHLIPCCDVLKSLILVDANEKVVKILKYTSGIFLHYVRKNVVENVSILRGYGVPQSVISILITSYPCVLSQKADTFDECVKEVIEMGFNPLTKKFALALKAVSTMSKSTWERKMEIYRRWGWSEHEILLAFKKFPMCMIISEKKITDIMDFLVNKMGWQSTAIARAPTVLSYSLEKRIIPRCSVVRVLLLKGLINEETPLSSLVICPEKNFLDTFVTKYQDQVPQLLYIFRGKMSILELGYRFEQKSGAN